MLRRRVLLWLLGVLWLLLLLLLLLSSGRFPVQGRRIVRLLLLLHRVGLLLLGSTASCKPVIVERLLGCTCIGDRGDRLRLPVGLTLTLTLLTWG